MLRNKDIKIIAHYSDWMEYKALTANNNFLLRVHICRFFGLSSFGVLKTVGGIGFLVFYCLTRHAQINEE